MIINLNGEWLLSGEKIEELKVIVPGSVITALLDNKVFPVVDEDNLADKV